MAGFRNVAQGYLTAKGIANFKVDDLLRRHVALVLDYTEGNLGWAAEELGVDQSTLFRWRREWARGAKRHPRAR